MSDIGKDQVQKVAETMVRFINENTNDRELKKSMLYSIQAGGKRIRPRLLLTTVAAFGKACEKGTYQVAAALEMIHTYSLIHDDLPAMDDDKWRRGKPTNHVVFGAGMATLAGDGLLTGAFQLLSQSEIDPQIKLALIEELAQAAGTSGMVAGQAADIRFEGERLDLADLMHLHARKTGALLCFATVAGGLLTGQDQEKLTSLRQLGQHLGLAFQIRDDLLDVLSTNEKMGKATHKDATAGKNTYPGLLGLTAAEKMLTDELAAANHLLEQFGPMFDKGEMADMIALFSLERGLSS